jgi:regulator of protease activity HflC (stomatin/prohibitin superfamily)
LTYVVVATIFLLLILAAVVVGLLTKNNQYGNPRTWAFGTAGVLSALFLVFTFFMSMETVGARSVGIQTAFGKYQDTLDPGFQLIAPWSNVEEFSTQIQPLTIRVPVTFAGEPVPNEDGTVSDTNNSVGGGNGSASAKVRWFIDADNAEFLWKKYRSFDNVTENLVLSSSQESLRIVVGGYTPTEAKAGSKLREITNGVKADLAQTLKDDGIKIDSVSGTNVNPDETTQASINKTVVANQDIVTALARERRSIIDGRTVANQQRTGALTDQALVRYCLDVVNSWNARKNGPLPAGFSCVGSSNPFVVTNK